MIRSNRQGNRVTLGSQLSDAVEQLHQGKQTSAREALWHSMVEYARQRPEVVALCCLAVGFWLGRKLSL